MKKMKKDQKKDILKSELIKIFYTGSYTKLSHLVAAGVYLESKRICTL